MADGISFKINTTEKDARWLTGETAGKAVQLDPADLQAACERSLAPGLSALRANVSKIGKKTGRLRQSPAILTRRYGRAPRFTAVGLLGYRSGVAPHARNVELGSPPRAGRGLMPALRPAWRAFYANRETMKSRMKAELEALLAKAVAKVS
jgi:hypothetical protein